jgi:hypothetical protein
VIFHGTKKQVVFTGYLCFVVNFPGVFAAEGFSLCFFGLWPGLVGLGLRY